MTKHIVLFSGGLGSYEVASRVVKAYGVENTILLYTDTLAEDQDLYRFLIESVHHLSGLPGKPEYLLRAVAALPSIDQGEARKEALRYLMNEANRVYPILAWMMDGRTPWEVSHDSRFISNTQVDTCSRVLKRELSAKFVKQFNPSNTVIHLGIDWTEIHRYDRAKTRWRPYRLVAILTSDLEWSKADTMVDLRLSGIRHPRAYDLGLPHNNCLAHGCLKGGLGYWKVIARDLPGAYAYSEAQEKLWQQNIGKPNTVLKLQRKPHDIPISLADFRGYKLKGFNEEHDIAGCGCMLG